MGRKGAGLGKEGRRLGSGMKGDSLGKEGRRLGEDMWPSGAANRPSAGQAGAWGARAARRLECFNGRREYERSFFLFFFVFFCCGLVLASGIDGGN